MAQIVGGLAIIVGLFFVAMAPTNEEQEPLSTKVPLARLTQGVQNVKLSSVPISSAPSYTLHAVHSYLHPSMVQCGALILGVRRWTMWTPRASPHGTVFEGVASMLCLYLSDASRNMLSLLYLSSVVLRLSDVILRHCVL